MDRNDADEKDFVPAFRLEGDRPPAAEPDPPSPAEGDAHGAAGGEPTAAKAAARTIGGLDAKLKMFAERLAAQEAATARLSSAVERIDSVLVEHAKRTQPMLETLSAELARQGAMIESLKTDTDAALDLHGQRVAEFEQRLGIVLRDVRELVGGKIESYDITVSDRMEEARQSFADQLAGFEERVEELVRRYAAEAIPDEMRATVEDLSSRFVHAETALAATRSSVEFLRGEVGQLTMIVRSLTPGPSGS